jgi:hypothetical protein
LGHFKTPALCAGVPHLKPAGPDNLSQKGTEGKGDEEEGMRRIREDEMTDDG